MGHFRILSHFYFSHTKIFPTIQKYIEPLLASMLLLVSISLLVLRLLFLFGGLTKSQITLEPGLHPTFPLSVINITYTYKAARTRDWEVTLIVSFLLDLFTHSITHIEVLGLLKIEIERKPQKKFQADLLSLCYSTREAA
uniref:Uncharacterized protein n=1 Tax=Rousettus aegyptiacus TaxID=9407 RepID=A0A7J8HSZ1_ROUAE|nr:hypothetical protein HJG63_010975 [Rousettus aegyptiacus]